MKLHLMRTLMVGAIAACAAAASPASAQFVGDLVNGTYYYPNTSNVFQNGGDKTVAPTATFNFATGNPNLAATVSSSSIVLNFDSNGGYNASNFNGVVFSDLTKSTITGATLVSSLGITGFSASALTYTPNSVSFNLSGITVDSAASSIVANVSFSSVSSAVPEPASWAMMILGFGLAGYGLRRRRVTSRMPLRHNLSQVC